MPPGTPFHGFIHPFPIRVDEFDSPASLSGNPALHLLSHTHTDHLVGLSAKSFSSTIICSQDAKEMLLRHEVYTERALQEMKLREAKVGRTFGHLKVSPVVIDGKWYYDGSRDLLRALPTNAPTTIELSDSESATITLIDANHCPGAVMFLVESAKGAVLHTGDFRAETRFLEAISQDKALQPYLSYQGPTGDFTPPLKTLDAIYLDTACQFSESPVPSKKEAVDGFIELMKLVPSMSIFFINAWTWGYEEILKAVGRAFGTKIHADSYKHGIYTHLSDRVMPLILTEDASSTRFHACERFDRCSQAAEPANNDRHVVYVNPVTMSADKWTVYFSETKAALRAGKRLDCLLIPLSRHSPLPELRAFVSMFRPKRIVPNTLDPQLHGLDWKCMARMYAGCLAPGGAMPGVATDARALELDEAQLGDAALKNVQGPEHVLELAMRWAESGAPRKKLEVMERYLTGGERTVVRRCLGLEQEWDLSSGEEEGAKAGPAQRKTPPPPEKRPFTMWDKAQLAQRINVCKRQKLWKPESQGSDEETDDDEEGRARMAHFLFAPLAGIEEPYPGGPAFSYETQDEKQEEAVVQEEVVMLEVDTVKSPAVDSLPTPSASPLSLRRDKGQGKAVEDLCMENDQLEVSQVPTPPPTAPRTLPSSPAASRTLKRKAPRADLHENTDHSLCQRHSQEDALSEKKNLPEENSQRPQEETTPASDPPHRAKRGRIQEWISSSTIIADTDFFSASPTSSQPPGEAELSAMQIDENMPQTQANLSPTSQRHSGRKSSGRNAPFIPNAPVQGASTMLIPSIEPPAFAPSASAETAKATDKEWRRAVRAKSRILAERLKKACPGASSSSQSRASNHAPSPRLDEVFARAQADTHRALAKSKARSPRSLAQASSFESVSNSVDENEIDWERSRRLAEQIREDNAKGRTLRVPRLECVENL